MPVMLQGNIAFEPEFVGNLAWLTRALIARDIDPDGVTIAKTTAGVAPAPRSTGLCYAYNVSTADDAFLVIETGDDRFLEKFLHHIEQTDIAAPLPAKGVFARLTRWMSPPA
ncbi:MAG: hypothetical protein QM576_07005 [Rhodopseudomonas sp.]|uniref:hypothetical protein n=1 Tax=unclassified Rhodopseudomonas TaxID=2638247 RepID=UPI0013DF49E6|nr:hypothetical protein [Rhodopseudomonas sp. BR0M22]NEW93268.1 hypothetical protein [Rhodopseudomonas sp. BR0M22]